MKLVVNINSKKSVDKTITLLENHKKKITDMILPDFLRQCAIWLIKRANEYVDTSGVGIEVREDIKNSWDYTVTKTAVIVQNFAEKAIYVEFGTGAVGESNPHAMAKQNNYHYNTATGAKNTEGYWSFTSTKDELDIPLSAVSDITPIDDIGGNRLSVTTRGAKNVSYAFNALMDLKDYGLKEIWDKIRKKYWG